MRHVWYVLHRYDLYASLLEIITVFVYLFKETNKKHADFHKNIHTKTRKHTHANSHTHCTHARAHTHTISRTHTHTHTHKYAHFKTHNIHTTVQVQQQHTLTKQSKDTVLE